MQVLLQPGRVEVPLLLRDLDTRIGLEDTLVMPDGSPCPDNRALVEAAIEILTAAGVWP